jgi:uncharacterized protein YaiL (DUF2058 family)
MQNLRDKLLKAGLVTETQVKKALEPPKPPPKPARPPQQSRPQQRPPQPQRALSETEQQAQQAFRAREVEVAEARRKDAAKAAEAKAQSERARALRALVQKHLQAQAAAGVPFGEISFHFVRRSGKVGRLLVTAETQALLEQGAAAVVENPGQPDPVVLPAESAKEAYRIDPRSVFFWNGPQKPIGFEDVAEQAPETEEPQGEPAAPAPPHEEPGA